MYQQTQHYISTMGSGMLCTTVLSLHVPTNTTLHKHYDMLCTTVLSLHVPTNTTLHKHYGKWDAVYYSIESACTNKHNIT